MNNLHSELNNLHLHTDERHFMITLKNIITYIKELMVNRNELLLPSSSGNYRRMYLRLNDGSSIGGMQGSLKVSRCIINHYLTKKIFKMFQKICNKYYPEWNSQTVLFFFICEDTYDDIIENCL